MGGVPNGGMHVHHTRRRRSALGANLTHQESYNPGPEAIRDPAKFGSSLVQLKSLEAKLAKRFPSFSRPVYSGGYTSFFDITSDLKFVLGADATVPNLFHCLGGGQALKYAPVLGRLIADMILEGPGQSLAYDLLEFSISRFEQLHCEAGDLIVEGSTQTL